MRKHRRRMTAAIAAALIATAAGPTAALAVPADAPAAKYPRSVPEKIGDTPADFAQPVTSAPVGDTKFDAPGARRAPEYEPVTTIEVVRPERTIVRDADPALPIVLAGLALLVAVGAGGTALVRMRSLRLG